MKKFIFTTLILSLSIAIAKENTNKKLLAKNVGKTFNKKAYPINIMKNTGKAFYKTSHILNIKKQG